MNYRVTIYNSRIYREVTISEKSFQTLSIGTFEECHVALIRSDYFEDFKINISKQGDRFSLFCEGDIYIKSSSSLKENVHDLESGDSITVRYKKSDADILYIDFMVDFGIVQDNYNLAILMPVGRVVYIGGASGSDIFINDAAANGESAGLTFNGKTWILDSSKLSYGVMVNGVYKKGDQISLYDNDFICINGYFFYLEKGTVYTTDSGKVTSHLSTSLCELSENHLKYPRFIRSVRQQYKDPEDKIKVLPPEKAPEKNKRGLAMTLVPSVTMLVAMILLRGVMGGRNMMYVMYFGISMGIGIVTSTITYFKDKKEYKEKMIHRVEKYNEYLDNKEKEIIEARENEKTIFRKRNRSISDTISSIEKFDSSLFEKSPEDVDFLDVCVGTGSMESVCQVDYNEKEYVEIEDPMMEYPEKVHDKYKYIDDMPVVLHLSQGNATGIIGVRSKLYQMAKNMLIEICGQHFYKDIKVFMIMDEIDKQDFEWIRWFKNLLSDDGSIRGLIFDDNSRKSGLAYLYGELSAREALKAKEIEGVPYYVIFCYRSDKIMNHPVLNYVDKAQSLRFVFVFFEEYEELLNAGCDVKVYLEPQDYRGYIQDSKDGQEVQNFVYDHVDRMVAERCALRLGSVYIDEISLESTLTKNITMYQLLGIMNAYDLNLADRWQSSKVYESMAAPIGVKSGGEILALDLHEKYHGPHGLVAGTTGSGKSELLQTYILSVATRFHPYEVSFIIIDFKGGGMANQFKDLPHLNGAITNIDGKQIDRSLLSIKAELMRRQELFAKYDVNQIDNYIRLYRDGKTDIPLPHLILIVDEFAELKSDQPEFMKELISAARIGRSLGVHLILATQKPAGVVNDQIWSNSKFKLCLKVQDKSDSNEVLKSPLAAEIREPGRAYLQVGNNEIFELFQSAYSGAPTHLGNTDNKRKFEINAVSLSGARIPVYSQKPAKSQGTQTQLEALTCYIHDYCIKNKIEDLPSIVLPPLGEILPYPDDIKVTGTDITVPIGIYDDPLRQAQNELEINFTQNHVFILGSSLSGKSYLLQSMIYGLASKYSPEDVSIYIIDFASMIMRSFEKMNHVGTVVTISEDDKLKNLMKFMLSTITERREKLADIGLSSYSAYREAGYNDMPQIILFVENYTVFRSTFADFEDDFLKICRDGVAVGISIVITNQQTSGIGYKLLTNFAIKIALNCNDRSQYSALLDRCRIRPDDVPGRGLIPIDNEIKEFQSYLAFSMGKEVERISKIHEFIEKINNKYEGSGVKTIVSVPSQVTNEFLKAQYGIKGLENNYKLIEGIAYSDTRPVQADLISRPLMGILGREDLGRIGYLRYCINEMEKNKESTPVKLYIVDNSEEKLSFADGLSITQSYTVNDTEVVDIIEKIHSIAKQRFEKLNTVDKEQNKDSLIMLMINAKTVQDIIVSDEETYHKFEELTGALKKCMISIWFTNVDNKPITPAGFNPIHRQIRDSGNLIMFENIGDIKILTIPMAIIRAAKKPCVTGDAFSLIGTAITRIKTPQI
ncbi:MAG: type VII secretion protein EssC [Butyrivibrio sp.]|uniref:type VII secretion protein EssC n=1 Tax=Butyrivibrio sp. TaxID=28121 RepID=UPI0025F53EE0|nr:type VII secretion protein EssC [Butyrivibrio sp.]MCR5772081.1 type VII secretion protein EssC [Butyrivibrio sp.]